MLAEILKTDMKFIYILLFAIISTNSFAKTNSNTLSNQVKELKEKNKKLEEELVALKSEVGKLNNYSESISTNKMILADVKKDMYESYLSNFNTILSIAGIISLILAFFGFKNIQSRLDSHKQDIDSNKSDLTENLKENKTLIIDHKKEIKDDFEKFETKSSNQIKDGLNYEYKQAIEKIMKGSIGEEVKALSEIVNAFEKRIGELESNSGTINKPSVINSTNAFEDDTK